ncbi:MAG TPA: DUF177 domain-containing protein [Rhizomicrobium sp.]|jgi:hypothetical protein|nr:DUF177 domain-containing protein [Rhizomicrobium sp.]
MSDAFPITKLYELGRVSQAGDEVTITPSADDRARIADWADIEAIDAFEAKIDVRKISPTRFKLDIALEADIVQSCVVTLEPVPAHISRSFVRELMLVQTPQTAAKEIELTPVDDDGREEIDSLRYDLAVPVLEEFALSIDPYPRAPGVAFEPPANEADSVPHPFAALKSLKNTT